MNGFNIGSVLDPTVKWQPLHLKLVQAYNSPGRFYHNLLHVASMIEYFRDQHAIDHSDELEVAAWFHDAVYNPKDSHNELLSAEMAVYELRNIHVPSDKIERIRRMILLTKGHQLSKAKTQDEQLFIDSDLLVLGSVWSTYLCYAMAIRREYGHVGDLFYSKERCDFLKKTLRRRKLFSHLTWLESTARANMEKEIKMLEKTYDQGHISWIL